MFATLAFTALGACAALCGCGRSMLLVDDSAGGQSSGSSSGAAPPAASAPDGSSGEDAAPSPPTPTGIGTLVFINSAGTYPAAIGNLSTLSGFLGEFDLGMPAMGCPTQHAGACVYLTCAKDLPYSTQSISAGTLTLGGGEIDGGTALPGMGDVYAWGSYSNSPDLGGFFNPGDTLTLSGSGDVVPAFMAPPVQVPQSGTLVAPQPGSEGYYPVPTSQDLAVQWSGGESGAQFVLQGGNGGLAPTSFLCAWDATLGQGVVPQSMLAPFKGEGIGINGELLWYQKRSATFRAGGFEVQESVLQYESGGAKEVAFY